MTDGYGFEPAPGQFGFRPTVEPFVVPTRIGWLLTGAGAVLAIAAPLPWATTSESTLSGIKGDGAITLAFGLIVTALGVVIGLRHGHRWVPITACVFAGITSLAALVDTLNVARFNTTTANTDLSVSVGYGLWITLAAAVLAFGLSALAIFRQVPRSAA